VVKRLLRAHHIAVPSDDSSCGSEDMDDVSISTDKGNAWPLHSDTDIHGSKISGIDIRNQQVITENLSVNSIDVIINIINDLLQQLLLTSSSESPSSSDSSTSKALSSSLVFTLFRSRSWKNLLPSPVFHVIKCNNQRAMGRILLRSTLLPPFVVR
jgi:hypothetical protein